MASSASLTVNLWGGVDQPHSAENDEETAVDFHDYDTLGLIAIA
jgi:hypothetical protein